MSTIQIRCEKEKRLFDVVDGSNLCIQLKCSNMKICAYKSDCRRTTDIFIGRAKDTQIGYYIPIHCPRCGKRLFNVRSDSSGTVSIKVSVKRTHGLHPYRPSAMITA